MREAGAALIDGMGAAFCPRHGDNALAATKLRRPTAASLDRIISETKESSPPAQRSSNRRPTRRCIRDASNTDARRMNQDVFDRDIRVEIGAEREPHNHRILESAGGGRLPRSGSREHK